ncbi:MAG: NlpC/P60 family protein [Paracoccaceae bacterium]
MTATNHDVRLTPARPDLAAMHLQGRIVAERYVTPERRTVAAPIVPLRNNADSVAIDTELLFGEEVDVLDTDGTTAWVQSVIDGYVGYVDAKALEDLPETTHAVCALGMVLHDTPALKTECKTRLPFRARVAVTVQEAGYGAISLQEDGKQLWAPMQCLQSLDKPPADWVAVAEKFLNVPYYWGGRSSLGIDCSGLVQLSLQATGHHCPRDSDMQQTELGRTLDPEETAERGDLIFWRGHVGIVAGPNLLLHANAHHMCVATEPLDQAFDRIGRAEFGQITRRARLDD